MKDKKNHILFVSDEYFPINNGGIARLLNTTIEELTYSGYQVSLLLCIENTESIIAFRAQNKNEHLTVYSVNELLHGSQYSIDFPAWINQLDRLHLSYRCALSIRLLCNTQKFDMIEFNDCWGLGYIFLKWRNFFQEEFTKISTWIRIHGTMENCMYADLIDTNTTFYPYHYNFFQMERNALKMADGIISPSMSVADWYKKEYRIENIDIAISTPSFEKLGAYMSHPRKIKSTPFKLLYYGRIQHLKGVDQLIDAVTNIYYNNGLKIQVDLIGTIINHYDQYLLSRIPNEIKGNFNFIGLIKPSELPNYAIKANAAVITSRTETFCLAAHELNWLGIPLIVNDIDAFKDFFEDQINCYKYNNSSQSLSEQILKFYSSNKYLLENNAEQIAKKHNTSETYNQALKRTKNIIIKDTYEMLNKEQYLSLFYLLTLHQNPINNTLAVNTSKKKLEIPNVFSPDFYKGTNIENLNSIILLLSTLAPSVVFNQDEVEKVRKINEEEVEKIKNFYEAEYEVLPLWYKQFGHIIKIITGKRSIKSFLKKQK